MASHDTDCAALKRPALYYFSPCYRQGEPRVVLLVGTAWRPQLRAHYGIDKPPFFSREAYEGEPDHFPNRHPWGWVFRPEKVLQYERASRRLPSVDLQRLEEALQLQIGAIPCVGQATAAAQPQYIAEALA